MTAPKKAKPAPRKKTDVNVDDIVEGKVQIGLIRTFVRWLLTQGPLVIGLYTVIGAAGWCAYWLVQYKVPEHTAQAHKSKEDLFKKIEEISNANIAAQDRETKQTTAAIKNLGDTFDKSMDRFDRFIRDVSKLPPPTTHKRMTPEEMQKSRGSQEGK